MSAARAQLRVLVVSPSLPYPPDWGFAKRVMHLAEGMAADHEVTLLCYVGPEDEDGARTRPGSRIDRFVTIPSPKRESLGKRARQALSLASRMPFHAGQLRDEAMQQALDRVLAERRPDVVMLESSQLGWLRVDPRVPVIVDEHNIESELLGRMSQTEASALRRGYNRWEHVRYRAFEQRVWQASAAIATTSQRDADAVLAACPHRPVAVVPNGVDPGEFTSSGSARDPDSLVFTGLLRYRPNVDGITWFLEEVLPLIRSERPAARLTIVGDGPDDLLDSLRRPGVTVTGWVPDVRPRIDSAAVVVVPLRMGGGTRLKVVEAMSMGSAIVSTRLGSEGLAVASGTHLELVDDPVGFAAAVVALLADPERAGALGAAARELTERQYSWARSVTLLQDLVGRVVGPSSGVPAVPAT